MTRYVYGFTEGGRDMADLLGGKGANLAEMTRLGLPVPPGFTVTTDACREYLATGKEPVSWPIRSPRQSTSWNVAPVVNSVGGTTRCSCPCVRAASSPCPS